MMVRAFSSVTAPEWVLGATLAAASVATLTPAVAAAVAGATAAGLAFTSWRRRAPAPTPAPTIMRPSDADRQHERFALFQRAIDEVRIGIALFDRDLRLVACNLRYREIYSIPVELDTTGLTIEELIRLNAQHVSFPGGADEYLSGVLADIGAGRPVQKVIELPNGRVLSIVNSALSGGGRISTHEDITNRRRNEMQVRDQKRQIDIALDNMSQGLVMYDENLRLIVCNRRYREMYQLAAEHAQPGFTLRDMLVRHHENGLLIGDPDAYAADFAVKLDRDGTVSEVLETADGHIYSITSRVVEGGGRVVTHDDITERHRLYLENLKVGRRLRERTQQLDTALSNMSQGLVMFDADGRVVLTNPRFLEIYKLSGDVVKPGCTLLELMRHRKEVGGLRADPEQFSREIIASVRAGGARDFVNVGVDGTQVRAQNRPMPDGGWVTTHEDITARQLAEHRLREQTLHLDTAMNNMTQGLVMFDAEARLVLCNARYLDMYRLSPDSVRPGMTLTEVLRLRQANGTFNRDLDGYVAQLRTSIERGDRMELIGQPADGRTIKISNEMMPGGGWVSTHEDITQSRKDEALLRQRKMHLDTALNSMTQGLNLFDMDGRLIFANERYREMYRLNPEQIAPGRTRTELVQARVDAGTFFDCDPREYLTDWKRRIEAKKSTHMIRDLPDGRVISVISQSTADGSGWVVTHEDISDRRRIERERDRSQAFATSVIENVPATIIVRDAKTRRYVLINRAGEAYFKNDRRNIIGKTANDLFPPAVAAMVDHYDEEQLRDQRPILIDEHPSRTPDGEARIVSTTRVPIRGPNGDIQYLLSVIEDRTNRKRAEAQIAHLAYHDALTGLPNRASFAACLDSILERSDKDNSAFALMTINVDRFKEINDIYGHAMGDRMLCEVSRRLQGAIGGAFVARLGGDEFAVIDAEGEQPAAAHDLAGRILRALSEDMVLDGHSVSVSVSIGVAIGPTNGADAETLTANADAALQRAKTEGRGLLRVFEASMDEKQREQRLLLLDMRAALDGDQFCLHYQPQTTIDGETVGFEALARWTHPTRGNVSPGAFIPLAEESGVILSLGETLLRQACHEAASWPKPLNIAVNISPVQFVQSDVCNMVHSVLLETGLSAQRLELEITEGVLIGDFDRALSVLRRLKALGVRIAMDDFGTGYSSLSYLQSFPFDKIKIDQTFISNLETTPQSATIVRAAIGLARGLGVPVIAEGVETKEQLAFLSAEGCDEIQGYLIGRPQPIESYAALVGLEPAARRQAVTA